jgi:flagellar basal body-associated protein FliL
MADEPTTTSETTAPKKGGSGKTILIILGVLAVLAICCCVGTILYFRSAVNDPQFKKEYCDQWEKQGNTPEQDPFKICK